MGAMYTRTWGNSQIYRIVTHLPNVVAGEPASPWSIPTLLDAIHKVVRCRDLPIPPSRRVPGVNPDYFPILERQIHVGIRSNACRTEESWTEIMYSLNMREHLIVSRQSWRWERRLC